MNLTFGNPKYDLYVYFKNFVTTQLKIVSDLILTFVK